MGEIKECKCSTCLDAGYVIEIEKTGGYITDWEEVPCEDCNAAAQDETEKMLSFEDFMRSIEGKCVCGSNLEYLEHGERCTVCDYVYKYYNFKGGE